MACVGHRWGRWLAIHSDLTCRRSRALVLVIGTVASVGCVDTAHVTQITQERAKAHCAEQGKEFFTWQSNTRKEHGAPISLLQGTCVLPNQVVRTTEAFGTILLADIDIKGAAVLKVTPDSIAGRAGLMHQDVVVNYAGRAIENAAGLRDAVADTPAGSRVVIKLHRNQQETVLTAQF